VPPDLLTLNQVLLTLGFSLMLRQPLRARRIQGAMQQPPSVAGSCGSELVALLSLCGCG
jgi:hypothetical protein